MIAGTIPHARARILLIHATPRNWLCAKRVLAASMRFRDAWVVCDHTAVRKLRVAELDAARETPVLDIKRVMAESLPCEAACLHVLMARYRARRDE
ncbi:MAG: hypothetical protein WB784_00420 [Rhodanobacteraceae bacterium]